MIRGIVSALHEISIRVPVRDSSGKEHLIESILDTGFNGSLTLPPTLIASLGLRWHSRGNTLLANGQYQQFELYAAIVRWDGAPRAVLVQAIDADPLLGMRLLIGYELRARIVSGGPVELEVIP